jgi:hypothetical protein
MKALGLTEELIGAFWAALATHELGHVIAGRSQGFAFQLFAVGPLWVERSAGDRYAVRFNRSAVAWGGRTRMYPTDAERLVRRYAVFVAGGPIASAFLALAAWGVEVLRPQGIGDHFFAPLAVLSLAVAIGTAQPFGSGGGFASDGGAFRTLLGGGDRSERAAALLALAGALVTGVRPRDLPAETVGRALVPSDGSFEELMALTTAAGHAGDRGERARAAAFASRAWAMAEKYPIHRGAVALEVVSVAAVEGDSALARRALAQVKGVEDYARLCAEAEVAALDGLFDEARTKARAGIAALERARSVPPSGRDRERLDCLAQAQPPRAREC